MTTTLTTQDAADEALAQFGRNQVVLVTQAQDAHDTLVASLEVSGCTDAHVFLSRLNEVLAEARSMQYSTVPAREVIDLLLDIRMAC